jgi:hypothetical protein
MDSRRRQCSPRDRKRSSSRGYLRYIQRSAPDDHAYDPLVHPTIYRERKCERHRCAKRAGPNTIPASRPSLRAPRPGKWARSTEGRGTWAMTARGRFSSRTSATRCSVGTANGVDSLAEGTCFLHHSRTSSRVSTSLRVADLLLQSVSPELPGRIVADRPVVTTPMDRENCRIEHCRRLIYSVLWSQVIGGD